jgi:hypothetical protein
VKGNLILLRRSSDRSTCLKELSENLIINKDFFENFCSWSFLSCGVFFCMWIFAFDNIGLPFILFIRGLLLLILLKAISHDAF